MKKYIALLILGIFIIGAGQTKAAVDRKALVDSLTTIDPEVRKYFPRWKICETDLQIQIFKSFKALGYDESKLNLTQIEILATPRKEPGTPFDILTISCGEISMNSSDIEANLSSLVGYISADESFTGSASFVPGKRDYCYVEIPPDIPVTSSQADAIISYLEPTNVTHSLTLSLFEQTLKIGDSGFWLRSSVGSDEIGYHFWESGQAQIVLKRPLIVNLDPRTRSQIPALLTAYLGGGYRVNTGVDGQQSIFDWISKRKLNGSPDGKIVAGFDFNLPMKPEFGLHFNMELPLSKLSDDGIERKNFARMPMPLDADNNPMLSWVPGGDHDNKGDVIQGVIPVLQSCGQVTLFYNWWLNKWNPENYVRFDFGMSYNEVQEFAWYTLKGRLDSNFITKNEVDGLRMYKPNELGDWIYLKAEYRNQSAYPFGFSLQYSNQMLLGRVYIPLVGNWFYIEGKYSTPLRGVRPYEIENFFMISPVIRITL
jgi:hypothetical protein